MTGKTEKIEGKANNRDRAFWLNSIKLMELQIAYFCSLYAVFHKRQKKKRIMGLSCQFIHLPVYLRNCLTDYK
jgi:hypothetical protein